VGQGEHRSIQHSPDTVRGDRVYPGWSGGRAATLLVTHPRQEPYAGKPLVRICAGCALKAHEVQLPEMVTAAKLSGQPRTESCVVASRALRSVDREAVGRNISEREDSPEIDRDRSSRPYPSTGKAESLNAVQRGSRDASGVRTAGMRPKDVMGTRESCQVQA